MKSEKEKEKEREEEEDKEKFLCMICQASFNKSGFLMELLALKPFASKKVFKSATDFDPS